MIGSGQVGPRTNVVIIPAPGAAYQTSVDYTEIVGEQGLSDAEAAAVLEQDPDRVVATGDAYGEAIHVVVPTGPAIDAGKAVAEERSFEVVTSTSMALTVRIQFSPTAKIFLRFLHALLKEASGRDVVIMINEKPDDEEVKLLRTLIMLTRMAEEIKERQGVELVWPGETVANSVALLTGDPYGDSEQAMSAMGKGARIKAQRRAREAASNPVDQANTLWRSEDESKFGRQGFGSTPFSPFHHTTRYILRALGELRNQWSRLHPDIPFSVVEVGSNTGYLAEFLAGRGFDIIATDIKSHPPWQLAVPWLAADARHLPLGDASVSAMVSVTSWEYVGPQVIDEAARVLAPGGVFVANSHFWGGDVSRMVVTGGLMAMRALHLQDNGDSAASRAQKYKHMKADIKNSRIHSIWLLNLMFRRTFRKFADVAHAKRLIGQARRDVEMLAFAGEGLRWIVGDGVDMNSGLPIEQIGDLFKQRGFEVEHIGPLPVRLGGIVPLLWEDRLLGIRARRLGSR